MTRWEFDDDTPGGELKGGETSNMLRSAATATSATGGRIDETVRNCQHISNSIGEKSPNSN